ncbi:MAG: hypothetical protein J6K84_03650 [Oscillospiraceae bacterium]|nr:hypothetical protein [Oscillospiraceae bacterium]
MKSRFIFVLVASVLVLGILVGCGAKPTTPDAPNQAVDPDIPTDPNPSPNEGENPPSLPNDTPADPVFYGVTLEHDSAIGTVNGLKERYEAGETVTFTVESSNYMVDTITCNGAPITEQDGTYSFAIGSDVTISITYQLKPTTVNVTNDSAKGTVLGLKNEYAVGDRVTFTVSPNAGWAVYSVSVNGEELTLPYSYLVTDASPRDISLAVTYEEDTLEARRNKVVAYAKHLTGDYYHYEGGVPVAEADINNSTHNHKALSEDFIYRGVPYNEGLTSLAAYRTLPSEFVDGVYHITPTLFVQRWYWLFGLSCADIPLWSWRAVSGDVTFAAAQQMTPAHGCIQVGEYQWTIKNGTLVDTFADIENNGSAVMDAAYAQLQPGDACTRIQGGKSVGHAILITAVDHANQKVTYCDTNGSARSADEVVNDMELYRFGEFDKTVDYTWLRKQGYLPVTCAALREESETLETFQVADSAEEPSLQNLASGTLTANQPISHVVITITDGKGNLVKEYIRYWSGKTFQMSDFRTTRLLTGWDFASSNTMPQYQLYAKENTITAVDLGLQKGDYHCAVTAYNGGSSFDTAGNVRSQVYVVRDFDFTVE